MPALQRSMPVIALEPWEITAVEAAAMKRKNDYAKAGET